MARTILPASVESRLKGHGEIRRRLARADEGRDPQTAPFVTLSRQYGCAAYALAEALTEQLRQAFPQWDFTIYDRRLVEVLAEGGDITSQVIDSMSAEKRGMVAEWVDGLIADRPPRIAVFRHMARTMCSIAAIGQAILIGRGGSVITRGIAGGIHVRLIASLDWRLENLRQAGDEDITAELVEKADGERESFVRGYLGADVNDPELYQLTLNDELLSKAQQAAAITSVLRESYSSGNAERVSS